jgi:hypothetical protein
MDDSLYNVWINQLLPKRAGANPGQPAAFAEIAVAKCMNFVTKAFSLIEFAV